VGCGTAIRLSKNRAGITTPRCIFLTWGREAEKADEADVVEREEIIVVRVRSMSRVTAPNSDSEREPRGPWRTVAGDAGDALFEWGGGVWHGYSVVKNRAVSSFLACGAKADRVEWPDVVEFSGRIVMGVWSINEDASADKTGASDPYGRTLRASRPGLIIGRSRPSGSRMAPISWWCLIRERAISARPSRSARMETR